MAKEKNLVPVVPMYRPLTAVKLSVPFDSLVDAVSPTTYATVVPIAASTTPPTATIRAAYCANMFTIQPPRNARVTQA
ncbi:hypothetical protein AB0B21_33505 [Streptomyces rimosus]|uniref:hypothetical protein n=1 Tax=Streptomyces rimosus TaxID=1927 RepID=UPI00131DB5BB|nr:hypothetical protein [Streptomyces rimosus]